MQNELEALEMEIAMALIAAKDQGGIKKWAFPFAHQFMPSIVTHLENAINGGGWSITAKQRIALWNVIFKHEDALPEDLARAVRIVRPLHSLWYDLFAGKSIEKVTANPMAAVAHKIAQIEVDMKNEINAAIESYILTIDFRADHHTQPVYRRSASQHSIAERSSEATNATPEDATANE